MADDFFNYKKIPKESVGIFLCYICIIYKELSH